MMAVLFHCTSPESSMLPCQLKNSLREQRCISTIVAAGNTWQVKPLTASVACGMSIVTGSIGNLGSSLFLNSDNAYLKTIKIESDDC